MMRLRSASNDLGGRCSSPAASTGLNDAGGSKREQDTSTAFLQDHESAQKLQKTRSRRFSFEDLSRAMN